MVTSALSGRLATLALLWLAGVYLRLPILIAPPLAPLMGAELGLNQTLMGALTTVPVLMLSLGALPGSFIIARLGARAALVAALVVLTAASAARGFAPPVWLVFANTALLGFAIAVMQPGLPILVLRWCPGFTALASAVYMNGLLMGEFIGGGLTLPIVMPLLDGSWRATLVAWSLPALLVAALLLLARGDDKKTDGQPEQRAAWQPPWREGRVWRLGIVLGAASSGFFGANAYMGAVLDAWNDAAALPRFLFLFNGTQVAGSLLMLPLARLLIGKRRPIVAMAWGVLLSLIGFGVAGGWWLLAATLVLGFCTCLQLILAVSLVPQIADARQAGPLSAGMFAVGYLLGFVVPLAGGVVADLVGDARAAVAPMVLLAAAGVVAARSPRLVD